MLAGKTYKDDRGRTLAMYPSPGMAWSQDVNVGSHLGSWQFDETVDGTATKKPIFCPGNMIVVAKQREGMSNAIILNTILPEHWANDTVEYYHIRLVHDDDISDIKLNQVFHQGDKLYDEGTKGNATGPHIHMEVGRGKYPGVLRLNGAGNNALRDSVEPWKVFFINDTKLLQGFNHPWRIYLPPVPKPIPSIYYPIPRYFGGSIVDALKAIRVNSALWYRLRIAVKNGIPLRTSAYNRNVKMLTLLKTGKLKKA